ncbi:MAG: GFA family protein [Caulobacteraceae bacterium]
MLTGGCCCGAVRYEAGGEPIERALCHCSICRATTGAPAVAWFTVKRADFRFTAGAPASFASTPKATREFCATCGTQLTFAHEAYGGKRIDITTASLDHPEAAPPLEHIWTRSRLGWMTHLDALPEHTMADRP